MAMPQLHAALSGGAFLGVLLRATLSAVGVPLAWHLLGLAVLVALVLGLSSEHFLPEAAHRASPESVPTATGRGDPAGSEMRSAAHEEADYVTSRTAWAGPRTLLIGLLVLDALLTEGSANDWLAKARVDGLS